MVAGPRTEDGGQWGRRGEDKAVVVVNGNVDLIGACRCLLLLSWRDYVAVLTQRT